jgi:hypothetical protein
MSLLFHLLFSGFGQLGFGTLLIAATVAAIYFKLDRVYVTIGVAVTVGYFSLGYSYQMGRKSYKDENEAVVQALVLEKVKSVDAALADSIASAEQSDKELADVQKQADDYLAQLQKPVPACTLTDKDAAALKKLLPR